MSTPRTDEEAELIHEADGYGGTNPPRLLVPAFLAGQLETELNEANAKNAESANVIIQFMDRLDLNRDEFLRIKAIASSPEIVHLCERSQVRITQTVPVIEQRDKAVKDLTLTQSQLKEALEILRKCERVLRLTLVQAGRTEEHYEATELALQFLIKNAALAEKEGK